MVVLILYIYQVISFRAGGKENFFHCDKCGFCLSLEKRENHTCRQNISKNNCPICLEVRNSSTLDPLLSVYFAGYSHS